jgi:hypothetical protein
MKGVLVTHFFYLFETAHLQLLTRILPRPKRRDKIWV